MKPGSMKSLEDNNYSVFQDSPFRGDVTIALRIFVGPNRSLRPGQMRKPFWKTEGEARIVAHPNRFRPDVCLHELDWSGAEHLANIVCGHVPVINSCHWPLIIPEFPERKPGDDAIRRPHRDSIRIVCSRS